jgi:hypothetical protein
VPSAKFSLADLGHLFPLLSGCNLKLVLRKCLFFFSINKPSTVRNTLDNQLDKGKGLFWLMISEVSVHGYLALLLGPVMAQYSITGVCGRRGLFTSWFARK